MNADLLRRIQVMTVSGTERHWALIPPATAKRLRPRVDHVADALLTMMARSDALRLNRVTALGHRGEASAAAIDTIIERYREAKIRRFSLLLGPGPQAERIRDWLEARGFRRHQGYVLLVRDARIPVPKVETDLSVRRTGRAEAARAVDVLAEAFAMGSGHREWAIASNGSTHYEHYMAFAGRTAVAVGAMRIDGDLAWLGGAATRTRWRGRGAQSAIIAARLRRAQRAGCAWAWSETAEPVRGRPDGSRRNLVRFGFEPACVEPVYVWEE
jgi:hypothetical protein